MSPLLYRADPWLSLFSSGACISRRHYLHCIHSVPCSCGFFFCVCCFFLYQNDALSRAGILNWFSAMVMMCFHWNDFLFFAKSVWPSSSSRGLAGIQGVVKVLEVVFLPKCRIYDLGHFSSVFSVERDQHLLAVLETCSVPGILQPLSHLIKQCSPAVP